MLSGRITRRKVCPGEAPRLRAASSSEGWMLRMIPISDSTMKGRVICTSPTITPKMLYISGSGASIACQRRSVPLMRPLSPSSTIMP